MPRPQQRGTGGGYAFLLFDEVRRLLSLRDFLLVKVDREQNKVAYCLANFGRSDGSTTCCLRHVPDCALQLVIADCNIIIEE